MLLQMCPKKSEEFDENQPNVIDTDDVSRASSDSSINPDINSCSTVNSITSSSSSRSTSVSPVIFCDSHNQSLKNEHRNNKNINLSARKLINYESVSSLSVSSSPESVSIRRSRDRDPTSRALFNTTDQISVPRTVPCVVLSPSINPHNPYHHQPVFNTNFFNNNPSLIMPLPMFQSNILSKLSSLPSKNSELGIQRFQDFCVDQNSNNPTLPNNNTSRNLYEETSAIRKAKQQHINENKSLIIESLPTKRLSFGIDRILSDENLEPHSPSHKYRKGIIETSAVISTDQTKHHISKTSASDPPMTISRQPTLHHNHHHQHQHNNNPSAHSHHHQNHPPPNNNNPINLSRCTDCYFLGRYCRNNSNLQQYSSLLVNSSVSVGNGGPTNAISASFPPWLANASIYENSPLLSPSAYHHHPQSSFATGYDLGPSNYSSISNLVSCNTSSGVRRKRSWSRAVFSSLQRKGLEKRFQIQKYITKPDRRQLAATLGLTDAQVKVWFQNRRMKWRHSKEGGRSGQGGVGSQVSGVVGESSISTSTPPVTTSSVSGSAVVSTKTTVLDK